MPGFLTLIKHVFCFREQGWMYVKGAPFLEGLCHLCSQLDLSPTHSPIAVGTATHFPIVLCYCTSYSVVFRNHTIFIYLCSTLAMVLS